MAIFRKLHTTFWTDPFVENLTQEQKLFYVYMMTNTKTTQCGIYEISKKYISYETGFSIQQVSELLNFFMKEEKIFYSEKTNEIAIANWWKYNWSTSPKVLACIRKELKEIKDRVLIEYLYSMDRVSILNNCSCDSPLIEYGYSIDTHTQEEKEEEQTEEEQTKEEAEVKEETKEEVSKKTFIDFFNENPEEATKQLHKEFNF
jgi:hypothetical protein